MWFIIILAILIIVFIVDVFFLDSEIIDIIADIFGIKITIKLRPNNPDYGTVKGAGRYQWDWYFEKRVEAIPNEGYKFVNWTKDGEIVSDDEIYIVKRWSCDLVANFKEDTKKVFSISETQKVVFAKGNLQYQASTKKWRFAEKQWDYVGEANKNISPSYSGWIDLFGWGTGDNPTKSSEDNSDYPSFNDWGNYCGLPTPAGTTGKWRTLTDDEWNYVKFKRTTSSNVRFAKAKVNGVNGIVIAPDKWNTSTYSFKEADDEKVSFDTNIILASTWRSELEPAGCVFLPAAGFRKDSYVYYDGSSGEYWSSTPVGSDSAYCLYFGSGIYHIGNSGNQTFGRSARLVADIK